jgi:hypothetical protein
MKNQTATKCISYFLINDFYNVLLNFLRLSLFSLYIFWLIIALKTKQLRNHNMILMYNLCLIRLFYCLTGILTYAYTPCDKLSISVCFLSVISRAFKGYYTGYSLIAMAFHRLGTILVINKTKTMIALNILIVFGIIWIIPIFLTVIQVYGFNNRIHFDESLNKCVHDASSQVHGFVFFFVFSYLFPNLLVLGLDTYEIRKTKEKSEAFRKENTNRESLRIIIQLLFLSLMYNVSCFSNLFILYLTTQVLDENDLVPLFDIFRWLFHFCPLSILYSHPILISKYKDCWKKLKNRNSVDQQ